MTALTCKRTDLAWALKAALPHVCRDNWIESLCGVRLEVVPDDKTLWCIATDRYTLGAAKVDLDGVCDETAVTMPTAEVRDLLRKLPDRDKNAVATLEFGENSAELDGFYRFRVQPRPGDIPGMPGGFWVKWRQLIGPMLRYPLAPPSDDLGYNAAYLARFASVARDGLPATVLPVLSSQENSKSAMTVVLAEDFAGVIMAARGSSAEFRLRQWRALIPVSEAKP